MQIPEEPGCEDLVFITYTVSTRKMDLKLKFSVSTDSFQKTRFAPVTNASLPLVNPDRPLQLFELILPGLLKLLWIYGNFLFIYV